MTKHLTEKTLNDALNHFENYTHKAMIGVPIGHEDLNASGIVVVHVSDYVEMDTKALIAQGYTKHRLYPNGWMKLVKP